MTNISDENSLQKIAGILSSIGFSKNEILIYFFLLREPASSALYISKKINVHRTNVYDSLRSLIEKGFVYTVTKNEKREYSALPMEKLSDYFKGKEVELKEEISKVKISPLRETDNESISFHRGAFALKSILYDFIREKKPMKLYDYTKELEDLLGEAFIKDYFREILKNKTETKIIFSGSGVKSAGKIKRDKIISIRRLVSKESSKVFRLSCGNMFVIGVLMNPVFCIMFKNDLLAGNFDDMFDLLWSISKKMK